MSFGINHSSTDTSFQNSGTTANQGAVSKTLSPEQAAIQPSIFATLQKYMMDPQDAVNPSRMAARNQVNNDYSGVADRVRQQFLTTGGGSSGKAGQAQLQSSIGQAGDLANADNTAAQAAAALPLTAEQLAAQFLGINMGQTSSSTGQTSNQGTGTSSTTGVNAGIGGSWSSGAGLALL